jgi:hypothetical protein
LRRPQPLAKHDDPEQHVDEWRDEVAKARFDDEPGVHRVDVEKPVHADQDRGDRIQTDHLPRHAPRRCLGATTACDRREHDEREKRPDDAMAEDLKGGNV